MREELAAADRQLIAVDRPVFQNFKITGTVASYRQPSYSCRQIEGESSLNYIHNSAAEEEIKKNTSKCVDTQTDCVDTTGFNCSDCFLGQSSSVDT
ncbi:hypothetical protein Taro_004091, partial [Colocasia esculenta]|nr:hypothetical protein [Colocasia esculenta]